MEESQQFEFKESWRDDYLKTICAFANAQGGTMHIGRDDNGNVVGVKNIKKLLEDVPNKIQSGLAILADVNKRTKDGMDFLEIKVAPSTFPINYHGAYYYRSGSTTQLLTGLALQSFLTQRMGIRWEDVTVDGLTVDDLDGLSFEIFRRRALKWNRMTQRELDIPNAELLDKLNLMVDGKLKRSGVLLFYGNPSIIQTGSHVQIGKFGQGPDLQYQDFLGGSLIRTAEEVIDLIYLKYLKAKISFEHDCRIETYPYAREAIREAVYNAIAHNCYMYGTPIQIRIENEQIIISNRCILPEGWTVETLMEPHNSIPYNPDIANVFYRAGYIEHWGRGIEKICDACRELGADLPIYQVLGNSIRVRFKALESALLDRPQGSPSPAEPSDAAREANTSGASTDSAKQPDNAFANKTDKSESGLVNRIISAIRADTSTTVSGIAKTAGVSKRTVERELRKLRAEGFLARQGGTQRGAWEINEERLPSLLTERRKM